MQDQMFLKEYTERTQKVQERITGVFQGFLDRHRCVPYIQVIVEAMEYSFLAGGKRLRPLLMQETYRLFKGNDDFGKKDSGDGRNGNLDREGSKDDAKAEEVLLRFMTALEMIHTYSLVHDDLPAMDNDEYRRGKKTTWKVFGDGMGVLAGDALLNAAFEMSAEAVLDAVDGDAKFLRRVAESGKLLAEKAGVEGMLGGQVADVDAEEKHLAVTPQQLWFIHTRKTAALIETAMGIGAILAGADEEQLEKVFEIARKIGIAFQIQDDILDVVGNQEELGKPIGSDAENGKQTYVDLMGLEASAAEVEKLTGEANERLAELPGNHEFLEALFRYLVYRRK